MGDLTAARIESVRRLLERATDAAMGNLEGLLASELGGEHAVGAIREMIDLEALDRRLRSAVFLPYAPLFAPPGEITRISFPVSALSHLWRALKLAAPELIFEAKDRESASTNASAAAAVYDDVCREAAESLRQRVDPSFRRLAEWLDGQPGQAERLATLLDLSPILRTAVASLPVWLISLDDEHAAALSVAFRTAAEGQSDSGHLFMEALFAHLEEPSHILRLISVVMDRPTDRYVAASELASFGTRLLDSIDANVEVVRRWDFSRGLEGGVATASAAAQASLRLSEFEHNITLAKEGVWGSRVSAQRRSLALSMEMRLREVEPAVFSALPAQTLRQGAKRSRGPAIVSAPPDPAAIDRALSLVALLDGCRLTASSAGFGALRTKVAESLDTVLDAYTQELVELLHATGNSGINARNIRAFLDVAAEFIALVRDPKSADLVRRRAAAA